MTLSLGVPPRAVALGLTLLLSTVKLPAQIQATRDLRIDGEVADFSRIVAVSVGKEGSIYAMLPDDGKIRVFSATGKENGSMGGKGEGPGEFRSISRLRGWSGDLFWLYDLSLARVSTFSPQGKLVGTTRLPAFGGSRAASGGEGVAFSTVLGRNVGGSLLWYVSYHRRGAVPEWARSVADSLAIVVVASDSAGEHLRPVAVLPGACNVVVNGRVRPLPECAAPQFDASPDAMTVVAVIPKVDDDSAPLLEISLIGIKGDTIFRIRQPVVAAPIRRSDADSIRRARIGKSTSPELVADFTAMALPKVFSPVTAAVVGRDSTVWIGLHPVNGQRPWLLIDSKGKALGTVSIPVTVRIDVVSRYAAWGVEPNADGVESVVRYRIRR